MKRGSQHWRDILAPLNKEETRWLSGIYCCWAGSTVLYIGTSARIYVRLCEHNRKRELLAHGIDRVTWISASAHRFEMEEWLIRKHRPLLNRAPGRPRAALLKSSAKAA